MYPYLISQILKGVWFLRPEDAIAGHVIVNNILTGVYRDEKFAKTLAEITPIQQLSHDREYGDYFGKGYDDKIRDLLFIRCG